MRNISFEMGESGLISKNRNLGQRIMTEMSVLTHINK